MATEFSDAPPPPGPPTGVQPGPETGITRLPRGHPLIAWIVIIAAAVGLFVLRLAFQPPAEVKESDAFEIQAHFLVGMANLPLGGGAVLYEQAKEFNKGSVGQRLRFVVLAGELKGPDEALKQLQRLKQELGSAAQKGPDAENQQTAAILDQLYRNNKDQADLQTLAAGAVGLLSAPLGDGPLAATADLYPERIAGSSAPPLADNQRQELQRRLGWFGALALHPRNGPDPAARDAIIAPAQRLVVIGVSVELLALGGAAVGFILLVLFFLLWRHMRSRLHVGSPFGGVYAETFAVWMVLFIGLSVGGAFLARYLPPSVPDELPSGLGALLSVGALAWPVLRGVPWRQVRRDIGWVAGDRPVLEPFCGLLCYLAMLPLVLLLVVVVTFGMKWAGHDLVGPDTPTHPIVDKVLRSGWRGWIQAIFLASVVAPIMEETM
ncbi:MAG TPA: hypothetical protein VMS17_27305, partial [Gemmataceae bacterium]|nr:hypothetical protein [Gemmataceae bacterium]